MGTTPFSDLLPQLAVLVAEARCKLQRGHQRQACVSILEGAFEVSFGVQRITADLRELYPVFKAKQEEEEGAVIQL